MPLLVGLLSGGATPAQPGRASLRALGLGFSTGLVYFVGTVYWTSSVMSQFGDLPAAVAVLLMLLLAAYLALYPAVFALLVHRVTSRFGAAGLLVAPAAWVTTELGRTYLFTGFPWVLLGYSQVTVLPIAQLASLFGVYGISLLLASVNAALAYAALPRHGGARWRPLAAVLIVVVATAVWGGLRLRDSRLTREGTPFPVALVQGNIAQEQKWDPSRAPMILRRYLDMSRNAAAGGAKLIIWPESSLPFYLQEDAVGGAAVRRLAFESRAHLLVGSDQIERTTPPRYFNSAFLITPDGTIDAVYRKMHLVPFGEYVPLKPLLFFAGPLVEAVADFSAGDAPVMMPVGGHNVTTAICYEVVYPDLARHAVAMGSHLLTTITNDAWYGRSSAPWQHFEQASMRAVEQGRYLARSANTGVSGIVDPYGRVLARSSIFEQTTLLGEIRFLEGRTVYARIGDVLAYGCAMLTLAALLLARRRP
ncbi:MAG: apolipoprotein N-acyltransferase [Acidobacteria bacterium]|nr:MAG: apolipoprotein N-acyltransferase [Acidobacteriota bacterium]